MIVQYVFRMLNRISDPFLCHGLPGGIMRIIEAARGAKVLFEARSRRVPCREVFGGDVEKIEGVALSRCVEV